MLKSLVFLSNVIWQILGQTIDSKLKKSWDFSNNKKNLFIDVYFKDKRPDEKNWSYPNAQKISQNVNPLPFLSAHFLPFDPKKNLHKREIDFNKANTVQRKILPKEKNLNFTALHCITAIYATLH